MQARDISFVSTVLKCRTILNPLSTNVVVLFINLLVTQYWYMLVSMHVLKRENWSVNTRQGYYSDATSVREIRLV